MLEDLLPFAFIGGALALIAIGVVISKISANKRRKAFATAAQQLGFSFEPDGGQHLVQQCAHLHLFTLGDSGTVSNYSTGSLSGIDVSIFDYRYSTGSGKSRHTHHQTVLYIASKRLDLPLFELRPENIFYKFIQAFGYQDIDFQTHPKFSSKYLLRGTDEAAIRAAFTPAVLDFFEKRPGRCSAGMQGDLLLYRSKRRNKAHELRDVITEGLALFKLLAS